jgi:hypothetical protein
MKRKFFVASAASAIFVSQPLLAEAKDLTKRAWIAMNVHASGWPKPAWSCGSAVVWLDIRSGIYYRKGELSYGRTKCGAYTCEKSAIDAGNRASD